MGACRSPAWSLTRYALRSRYARTRIQRPAAAQRFDACTEQEHSFCRRRPFARDDCSLHACWQAQEPHAMTSTTVPMRSPFWAVMARLREKLVSAKIPVFLGQGTHKNVSASASVSLCALCCFSVCAMLFLCCFYVCAINVLCVRYQCAMCALCREYPRWCWGRAGRVRNVPYRDPPLLPKIHTTPLRRFVHASSAFSPQTSRAAAPAGLNPLSAPSVRSSFHAPLAALPQVQRKVR